tara:strand:+ start:1617 stop:1868 length:252 start_codon:yes stop_codon:yes gene_type:complete
MYKKITIFILFFLIGLFVLPLLLFAINDFIFGKYTGNGFVDFYNDYFDLMKGGNIAAWFISFSPYLVYLCARITVQAFDYFKN